MPDDLLKSIKLYVDHDHREVSSGSYYYGAVDPTAVTVTAGIDNDKILKTIDFLIPTSRSKESCGGTEFAVSLK